MLFVAARTMRLASIAACLITIASFALFVVGQTNSASAHQQNVLNGQAPVGSPGAGDSTQPATPSQPAGSSSGTSHEDAAHRAIDDASNTLTSPFSGVTTGWSSQWTIRAVRLLLALALYGFALGFVARVVRSRV